MFFEGPLSQAAILVYNLIKSVPQHERNALAKEVIRDSIPTSFGLAIAQFLKKTEDQNESERVLTEDAELGLWKAIADRVASEAQKVPPYLADSRQAARLLSMWFFYGDKDSLTSYLGERFDRNPKEAVAFLVCWLPTVWSGSTGLP